MGGRRKFVERTVMSFVAGTFARIEAVIGPGEDRTDFIREAVERELARRQKGVAQ